MMIYVAGKAADGGRWATMRVRIVAVEHLLSMSPAPKLLQVLSRR
jgi:hypothetical protein